MPIRVPVFTIENTDKRFFWLTNFLETLISACLWKVVTATTVVGKYKSICDKWADKTADSNAHVQWQCHNFSYRGMGGNEDAITAGAGHLLFFTGTDTIPSIEYLEFYYGANVETELIGASVLASEHSLQCQYQDDFKYFKKMITEVAPEGIISIVADGYDYWNVIGNVIPRLKDVIISRNGKLVIRPDSGDPTKIVCGDVESTDTLVNKGSVESLWDIFGGTINSKGYKVLDPHIGLIYGEAITPERAEDIFTQLEAKGFSSENIVFGVGSYSLGYYTRDTFGFALKATYIEVNGEGINIFKDPITDVDKIKKSQTGMLVVIDTPNGLKLIDGLSSAERDSYEALDLLEDVFIDGVLIRDEKLSDIRKRLQ